VSTVPQVGNEQQQQRSDSTLPERMYSSAWSPRGQRVRQGASLLVAAAVPQSFISSFDQVYDSIPSLVCL